MDRLESYGIPSTLDNGRYTDFVFLNKGSFGVVFKARDATTGGFVAIKCMLKHSATELAEGLGIQVLQRGTLPEELALHRMVGTHPNVVQVYDSFDSDLHLFVVLEYCEKGDLYEAITARNTLTNGPPPVEVCRQKFLEMCEAVIFIHEAGVSHRDLKPENVFVNYEGRLKIGDFGLATLDPRPVEVSVGSDRYMSPLQYQPNEDGYSSAAADIWALGICFLNVLFGLPLFTAPDAFKDPVFEEFAKDPRYILKVFPTLDLEFFQLLTHFSLCLEESRRDLVKFRDGIKRVRRFTVGQDLGASGFSGSRGIHNRPGQCAIGAGSYDSGVGGSTRPSAGFGQSANRLDIPKLVAASAPIANHGWPSFVGPTSWADMDDDDDEAFAETSSDFLPPQPVSRTPSSALMDEDDETDGVFSLDLVEDPPNCVGASPIVPPTRSPLPVGGAPVLAPSAEPSASSVRSSIEMEKWVHLGELRGVGGQGATSSGINGKLGTSPVTDRFQHDGLLVGARVPLSSRKSGRRSDLNELLLKDWRANSPGVSTPIVAGSGTLPAAKRFCGRSGGDRASDTVSARITGADFGISGTANSGLAKPAPSGYGAKGAHTTAAKAQESVSTSKTSRKSELSARLLQPWRIMAPPSPKPGCAPPNVKTATAIFNELRSYGFPLMCREQAPQGAPTSGFGLSACKLVGM